MRIGKRVHFNRGWLAGWPAGWQLQVGRGEHGDTYIHLGQEEGEEDFLGQKSWGAILRRSS